MGVSPKRGYPLKVFRDPKGIPSFVYKYGLLGDSGGGYSWVINSLSFWVL